VEAAPAVLCSGLWGMVGDVVVVSVGVGRQSGVWGSW
jgi:hypothetical protein